MGVPILSTDRRLLPQLHSAVPPPSSAASQMSSLAPFSVTTIEYTPEALRLTCTQHPQARFWDCTLGALHVRPDCEELYAHCNPRMYESEEVAPREAWGHCPLGACVPRVSAAAATITVSQIGSFATKLPGFLFVTRTASPTIHSDARCASTGSRRSVLCVSSNKASFSRNSLYTPCSLCM